MPIERAVGVPGKNQTDCLELSLDQAVFAVNPETYAAFLSRLNAPARPNARLRRSLQMYAPWEK